jgi:hypothetical protein
MLFTSAKRYDRLTRTKVAPLVVIDNVLVYHYSKQLQRPLSFTSFLVHLAEGLLVEHGSRSVVEPRLEQFLSFASG